MTVKTVKLKNHQFYTQFNLFILDRELMTSSAALIGSIATAASPSAGLRSADDDFRLGLCVNSPRHSAQKEKEERHTRAMALRNPYALPTRALSNSFHSTVRPTVRVFGCRWSHKHGLATASSAPAKGSKGPTAMVFLNMGGPSKTADVEDFLSRLFVRLIGVPTGREICPTNTSVRRPTAT